MFHEFLEHRWYLAQQAGHDLPLDEVIASYVEKVLPTKRDEAIFIAQEGDAPTPASHPDLW